MSNSIFDYELAAYKREIVQLASNVSGVPAFVESGGNLTHYSLGISNRSNMILVGMCGLVEALLGDTALGHVAPACAGRVQQMNRAQLVTFLKGKGIDLQQIAEWANFENWYIVRNAIVHGHGGIVPTARLNKLKRVLSDLGASEVLLGEHRIRLSSGSLRKAHSTVAAVVYEIL